MVGVYFSGTGNSRLILEVFCGEYDKNVKVFSIEDERAVDAIKDSDMLVFSYPVYYSTVPKILRDFINNNGSLWKGKKIFVIATMGLFSGDGAGMLAREFKKHGASVIGGLHVTMPDCICDVPLLKHTLEKNRATVLKAKHKARISARLLKIGKPTKDGLGTFNRMAGFFGQRLYFGNHTKDYSKKLKIDADKCVGCSKCESLCPMNNISIENGIAVQHDKCTMCYRCINNCPKQAITLIGKKVIVQGTIDKYL